jgi:hypothetical protein
MPQSCDKIDTKRGICSVVLLDKVNFPQENDNILFILVVGRDSIMEQGHDWAHCTNPG